MVLHIVIASRTLLSVTVGPVILVKSATTAVMVFTEPVDPVAKDIFSMRIPIAPVQLLKDVKSQEKWKNIFDTYNQEFKI